MAGAGPLTEAERELFRERGYLVRTGLLDPASLRRGCDLVWNHTPPFLDRAAPESWLDPPLRLSRRYATEAGEFGGDNGAGSRYGFTWKLRSAGRDGVGTEPWLLRMLPSDPGVVALAPQLVVPFAISLFGAAASLVIVARSATSPAISTPTISGERRATLPSGTDASPSSGVP